jgi:hypothetical protein
MSELQDYNGWADEFRSNNKCLIHFVRRKEPQSRNGTALKRRGVVVAWKDPNGEVKLGYSIIDRSDEKILNDKIDWNYGLYLAASRPERQIAVTKTDLDEAKIPASALHEEITSMFYRARNYFKLREV